MWAVRAVYEDGTISAPVFSEVVSNIPPPPPAVSSVRAAIADGGMGLTWRIPGQEGGVPITEGIFSHIIVEVPTVSESSRGGGRFHRFTPDMLEAMDVAGGWLTQIEFAIDDEWNPGLTVELRVYIGGTSITDAGTRVHTQTVPPAQITVTPWPGSPGHDAVINTINLTEAVQIPTDQELRFGMYIVNAPAGLWVHPITDVPNVITGYSDLIFDGAWTTLVASPFNNGSGIIRGFASSVAGEPIMVSHLPHDMIERYQAKAPLPAITEYFRGDRNSNNHITSLRNDDRDIINFRVYRTFAENRDNPLYMWTHMGIQHDNELGQFNDTTWFTLPLGDDYIYAVVAVYEGTHNTHARPAFSNVVATGVGPPINLVATFLPAGHIRLNWAVPPMGPGVVLGNYRLYRSVGSGPFALLSEQTGTVYTDTDVVPLQRLRYRLVAVYTNPAEASVPSDYIEVRFPTLYPPQDLVAVPSFEYITLNWAPPIGEFNAELAGYRVYRNGVAITEMIETLTFIDDYEGLEAGVDYTYTVRAVFANPAMASVPSAPATVSLVPIIFQAPRNLVATGTLDYIALTWDEPLAGTPGTFEYFRVYRAVGVEGIFAEIGTTTETEFTDEDEVLVPNVNFFYQVRAVYTDQTGVSHPVTAGPVQMIEAIFNPPRNLRYINPPGQVVLSWVSPIAGSVGTFQGVKIYRSIYEENDFIRLNEVLLLPPALEFTDEYNLVHGLIYQYRIFAVYAVGESIGVSEFDEIVTQPVSGDCYVELPTVTALVGNFPNPFNPATTIMFDIAREQNVTIEIFDIRGARVKTLVSEVFGIGAHRVVWQGLDQQGRQVSSGVYFYRMITEDYTNTRRMILLK
jgi:hypothetical protein